MDFEEKYFKEVYGSEYDERNPRYKFKSYFKVIKPFLSPRGAILDIGCAYGAFLAAIEGSYELNGCDISSYAISIAHERLPGVNLFVSDLFDIPEDKKYDLITCFDILEHIPDPGKALNKIERILSNGGILCLSVPVYDTAIGMMVRILDKDPTHVHKNSRHWWLKILMSNGYRIISWNGIWRYYFKGLFYLHFFSRVTRRVTPAIIIVCKKASSVSSS